MPTENFTLLYRREIAGWMLAISGAAAFLAAVFEPTDVLAAAQFQRAVGSIVLWGLGGTFLGIGAVLTANTLRGPKTRLSLIGCILACVGALWSFALYAGPALVRAVFVAGGSPHSNAALESALNPLSTLLVVPFVVLLMGGTLLALGLARAGITNYTTGALWATALSAFAFAGATTWVRALDAAALALALLVMGIHVGKHRSAIEGGNLPMLYDASRPSIVSP